MDWFETVELDLTEQGSDVVATDLAVAFVCFLADARLDVCEPMFKILRDRRLARFEIVAGFQLGDQAGTFILRLALSALECSPLADAFALGIPAMIDSD